MAGWFGELILATIVGASLWWLSRALFRRYVRFTLPDSNAPGGSRTDWQGFFGRRRR